jgi:hypothetical protein
MKKAKYKIHLVLEFRTRPTKKDVMDRLFNLLRDGFTLKHKEDYEKEIKQSVSGLFRKA